MTVTQKITKDHRYLIFKDEHSGHVSSSLEDIEAVISPGCSIYIEFFCTDCCYEEEGYITCEIIETIPIDRLICHPRQGSVFPLEKIKSKEVMPRHRLGVEQLVIQRDECFSTEGTTRKVGNRHFPPLAPSLRRIQADNQHQFLQFSLIVPPVLVSGNEVSPDKLIAVATVLAVMSMELAI